MTSPVTILAVDDEPVNLRLLEAVLAPRGHRILKAGSGTECLDVLRRQDVDLVLLDVVMPDLDGYEVCRRIRADERTAFLPVVMLTAYDGEQRVAALEAGADDFVRKPFDQSELLARVASLARIKRYQDTIRAQRAGAGDAGTGSWRNGWPTQVQELDRMSRLRRFLSPQLADVVMGDESLLASHRREVVVVFCDLRNFTTFAETSEPEEVMDLLREYHRLLGDIIDAHDGTLERFTGDGVMVYFNDPVPLRRPRRSCRADGVGDQRAACASGQHAGTGSGSSSRSGPGSRRGTPRSDASATKGATTTRPSGASPTRRPGCAPRPLPWEVLVPDRLVATCDGRLQTRLVGTRRLKGFTHPIEVARRVGLHRAGGRPG